MLIWYYGRQHWVKTERHDTAAQCVCMMDQLVSEGKIRVYADSGSTIFIGEVPRGRFKFTTYPYRVEGKKTFDDIAIGLWNVYHNREELEPINNSTVADLCGGRYTFPCGWTITNNGTGNVQCASTNAPVQGGVAA